MRNLVYVKVSTGKLELRTYEYTSPETIINCSALNHPRTLANKFPEVQDSFKQGINSQPKQFLGLLKPYALVHLLPKMEGGYTDVEFRFFKEAAEGAGFYRVFLLGDSHGPLQDHELKEVVNAL